MSENTTKQLNDGKVEIPIDLSDEEFLKLAKMAHERDITFNQLVEEILQAEIDRIKAENNE
jgi:predicted DNA-binding ribbon-helix-helix protein